MQLPAKPGQLFQIGPGWAAGGHFGKDRVLRHHRSGSTGPEPLGGEQVQQLDPGVLVRPVAVYHHPGGGAALGGELPQQRRTDCGQPPAEHRQADQYQLIRGKVGGVIPLTQQVHHITGQAGGVGNGPGCLLGGAGRAEIEYRHVSKFHGSFHPFESRDSVSHYRERM